MEVGPLARMLVAYAMGHKQVKDTVDMVLKKLGVGAGRPCSRRSDRTAARGVETLLTAQMLPVWIGQLAENMKKGDLRIHNGEKWDPSSWPREARGFGFHEAPRGALGHWINIKDRKIANYQAVVPSTWNGSPARCEGPARSLGGSARRHARWPIRTSPWRSCGRFIPSIPAWRARSMW